MIFGTWPADDLRRAFVAGAAWQRYLSRGWTPFAHERDEMEAEAERRYPGGNLPETDTADTAVDHGDHKEG